MSKMEVECSDATKNIRCETIPVYAGACNTATGLYTYKRYSDVRLVMAPEFDIAFFGGERTTSPIRVMTWTSRSSVYTNDKPISTPNYLKFTTTPVKENMTWSSSPVILVSTGRLSTTSQLEYLRDVAYPNRMKSMERH